jgi:sialate O-acetylesterase
MSKGQRNAIRLLPVLLTLLLGAVSDIFNCRPALAKVKLSPLFVDGGVIQRDKPVNVFGTGRPGEIVTCEIGGNKGVCIIKDSGNFFVSLPFPNGSGPFTLRVAGDNLVEIKDLHPGEVWIVAGDADMDRDSLSCGSLPDRADLPDTLQLFRVGLRFAPRPIRQPLGHWIKATDPGAMTFSALGLKFGCDLAKQVGGDIGIIQVTCPQTPIRAWISPAGLLGNSETAGAAGKSNLEAKDYDKLTADYNESVKKWMTSLQESTAPAASPGKAKQTAEVYPSNPAPSKDSGSDLSKDTGKTSSTQASKTPAGPAPPPAPPLPSPLLRNAASALFNGMLAPLTPYSVRGVIWYHGRSDLAEVLNYKNYLAVFMKDLRQTFRQDLLPIILVQTGALSDPQTGDDSPVSILRQIQYKARLAPRTYMAVSLDLDQKDKKTGKITTDMTGLAQRLTNIALSTQYHTPAVFTSPVIETVEKAADGEALKLQLRYADKGLQTNSAGEIKGFSVSAWNHQYFDAQAQIEGDTIVVQSKFVKEPRFVRYCWGNSPTITIFNRDGLPLMPYTSDR